MKTICSLVMLTTLSFYVGCAPLPATGDGDSAKASSRIIVNSDDDLLQFLLAMGHTLLLCCRTFNSLHCVPIPPAK